MPIDAVIFDKDGVLLDLSQTWFLTICNIAKHTEGLIDGRVPHRALLDVIGVELNADGISGHVVEKTAPMPRAHMVLLFLCGQPLIRH